MPYLVINLYDGTHELKAKLPKSAFFGLEGVESKDAIVWRGEEVMIVQLKDSK